MVGLEQLRTKVNSKTLPLFLGKPVSILGKIKQVHSNGSSFELEATDGGIINAILQDPLNEPIEGWVEVRGEVQGRCHITVHHHVPLRDSIMADFGTQLQAATAKWKEIAEGYYDRL